jgi:DNA-directed RNA polymerase subunit RPC12/RpoP
VSPFKCGGCGAEVVVNTAEQMGARCHWCRHVLTINEQIPNGAVPDAVLPFHITHDDAVARSGVRRQAPAVRRPKVQARVHA